MITIFLITGALGLAGFGFLYLESKSKRSLNQGKRLCVVSSQKLGNNTQVFMVNAINKTLVVATNGGQLNLLAQMDGATLPEAIPNLARAKGAFAQVFGGKIPTSKTRYDWNSYRSSASQDTGDDLLQLMEKTQPVVRSTTAAARGEK